MPQIKIVFSDVDNTLITSENKILPTVATAVHNYVDDGGTFVLASARPPLGMHEIARQLGTTAIMITLNGALVLQTTADSNKDHTLFEQTLQTNVLPQLLHTITRNKLAISVNIFAGEKWLTEHHDDWVIQEEEITQVAAAVGPFAPELGTVSEPLHKILCMGQPAEISALATLLAKQPELHINYQRSKPTYLEIVDSTVSKMKAIEHVARLLDVPLSQTMAIGDGDNDLPMIKDTGIGIAVENAFPTVKAVADHIVSSNNDGGVAEALIKYTN